MRCLILLLRVLCAPLALLLIAAGWLLRFVWDGFGFLSLLGMWMLGKSNVIG